MQFGWQRFIQYDNILEKLHKMNDQPYKVLLGFITFCLAKYGMQVRISELTCQLCLTNTLTNFAFNRYFGNRKREN